MRDATIKHSPEVVKDFFPSEDAGRALGAAAEEGDFPLERRANDRRREVRSAREKK